MQPYISAGMKANLRRISSSMFTQEARVLRHSVVDTAYGMSDSWNLVVASPCWLRQMNNPDLKAEAAGIYALGIFRILFPWGTDVRPADHVEIEGATYLVQNTNSEDANPVNLVCIAQRLENR